MNETVARSPVSSPCTKVCALDPATGWCLGCGRSGAEIAGWLAMDEETRRALLAKLPERMEKLSAAPA